LANRRLFWAKSAAGARHEAMVWLRDFEHHEPIDLREIRVLQAPGGYAAVVIYGEGASDATATAEQLQAWLWGRADEQAPAARLRPKVTTRGSMLAACAILAALAVGDFSLNEARTFRAIAAGLHRLSGFPATANTTAFEVGALSR
jgi:hypothetical protein